MAVVVEKQDLITRKSGTPRLLNNGERIRMVGEDYFLGMLSGLPYRNIEVTAKPGKGDVRGRVRVLVALKPDTYLPKTENLAGNNEVSLLLDREIKFGGNEEDVVIPLSPRRRIKLIGL